jgi:hypothetical protein
MAARKDPIIQLAFGSWLSLSEELFSKGKSGSSL